MRFSLVCEVPYPRDTVFAVQRQHLPELVEYLPNVDEIVRTFQEDDGDITRVRNSWRGSSSEIPAIIRPMVPPDLLSWHDQGTWYRSRYRCEWQTFLPLLEGAITAKGVTTFEAEGDETLVRVEGEFTIDPNRISYLTPALAKVFAPAAERFIVDSIQRNIRRTFEAVGEYIAEHQPP